MLWGSHFIKKFYSRTVHNCSCILQNLPEGPLDPCEIRSFFLVFLVGTRVGWGGDTTAEWAQQRPRMLDPPGRIFESLSWEVEAGDPVDAGTVCHGGRWGVELSLGAVCTHVCADNF